VVVSVGEKPRVNLGRVSIRETNENEPFEDSSLRQIVVKTRDACVLWDKPARSLMTGQVATGEKGA
jgi:hypothetical protein